MLAAGLPLSELGLTDSPVTISVQINHLDIAVDAFGGQGGAPPELQCMLGEASINMTLVHFDPDVLNSCLALSYGGAGTGTMPAAGTRMGANAAVGAAPNKFISLTLSSPVEARPWNFPAAFLTNQPMQFPIGAERSVVSLTWRAIPYTIDPITSAGVVLFTN